MQPIDAYQHASARARRLLRYHDGLVNIRQRRIRSDWKSSFCKFMRWKQDSDIDRVDSREALIVLRDGASLEPSDFASEAVADLLRSALVLGMSALDRYVHERVVKGIVAALRKPPLSKAQEEFSIPAVLTLQVTKSLTEAHRKGRQLRPANEVRKKVQEILHRRPFQSWGELESAFALIGIRKLESRVRTRYQLDDISPIREQLNDIAKRRNWIVHEGDLVRHQRGGATRCNSISPGFVRKSLDFLDTFAGHLDKIQ